jgi:hypothetical protein
LRNVISQELAGADNQMQSSRIKARGKPRPC